MKDDADQTASNMTHKPQNVISLFIKTNNLDDVLSECMSSEINPIRKPRDVTKMHGGNRNRLKRKVIHHDIDKHTDVLAENM